MFSFVVSMGESRRSLVGVVIALCLSLVLFASAAIASDFTATTIGDFGNVTVMEVEGNYDAYLTDGTINFTPRKIVANEFYRTHKDEYDFFIFFSNFDFRMPESESVAFYLEIKNDVHGIGQNIFDHSFAYGSEGRLQGTIDMGNLGSMATDPLDPAFDHTIGTLNHEILHRWGAHLKFRDQSGRISTDLLGRNSDHWSSLFDTHGSLHYGSNWQDNGDGTFTAVETPTYFSPLDLYAMGMIDADQVPPMLLIDSSDIDPTQIPQPGTTINGTGETVTIDDIIAAEGPRIPSAGGSQKSFKTAFIYLTAPDTFDRERLSELEAVRNGFLTRFSILTDGEALVRVVSEPMTDLPTNPGVSDPVKEERSFPPSIEDGVAWLKARQDPEGAWSDSAQTSVRDTSESMSALTLFAYTETEVSRASDWLASGSSGSTDYLARRTASLARVGRDTSALVPDLLGRQNSDGGWGAGRNYVSNSTDTALALRALAETGFVGKWILDPAMEYLRNSQNADGGWSAEGTSSQIQGTASSLLAINAYADLYDMAGPVAKAVSFLQARQNTYGGFGNSPSTVYDSAAAVFALAAAGNAGELVSRGLEYLLEEQSADGSWYRSPFQTAVTLRALHSATIEPDLKITSQDISFIPEMITRLPTNAVISAQIENLGRSDVAQATVSFYEGEVHPENLLDSQTAAFPAQAETMVTFSAAIEDGSEHPFIVVVDEKNLVEESSEANNEATGVLKTDATYDFEILPGSVDLSHQTVDAYSDVTVSVTVANGGTMDAYAVPLRFFVDHGEYPFEIGTLSVDIPAAGSVTTEMIWKASLAGVDMPLTVEVDPRNAYAENAEDNNRASQTLTVNPLSDPNLTVRFDEIVVEPDPVDELDTVNISAVVRNTGFSEAQNVIAEFYKGIPGQGGILLGRQTIASLDAGDSVPISASWSDIQESGQKVVYVVLDDENQVRETTEDDNEAFAAVRVRSLPDLVVTDNAISVNPVTAKEGDLVSIEVIVQNLGDIEADEVDVRLDVDGVVIGTQSISPLPGHALETVIFSFDSTDQTGAHQLRVFVDPANAVVEQSDNNNRASKVFGVQNSNLWVSEKYISPNGDGVQDSTQLFFTLDASQSVQVLVVNEAGETVRTIGGTRLENTAGGNVVWDGLSEKGTVVDDGEYRLQILALNGFALGEVTVVVDNNRSPFHEAVISDDVADLSALVPHFEGDIAGWLPDESAFLVLGTPENGNYGLYRASPGSSVMEPLNQESWYSGAYPNVSDLDVKISRTGNKVFAVYTPSNTYRAGWYANNSRSYPSELWVYDLDADIWTLLDKASLEHPGYLDLGSVKPSISSAAWSPDGRKIAYRTIGDETYVINSDGTGREYIGKSNSQIEWSTDSSKICYKNQSNQVEFFDLSGSKKIISEGILFERFEWLWPDHIYLIDDDKNVYTYNFNDEGVVGLKNIGSAEISSVSPCFSYIVGLNRDKVWIYENKSGKIVFEKKFTSESTFYSSYSHLSLNIVWSPDSSKLYIHERRRFASSAKAWVFDIKSNAIRLLSEEGLDGPALWMKDNLNLLAPFSKIPLEGSTFFDPMICYMMGQDEDVCSMEIRLIDVERGDSKKTDLKISEFSFKNYGKSPLGNYVFFEHSSRKNPLSIFRSLVNLTAELEASINRSDVSLNGTAVDKNFDEWKLEYSDVETPDSWTLAVPPSDRPVNDDIYAHWVPPYKGDFFVRLTVSDKAGNKATRQVKVFWGEKSSVVGLYKTTEDFSPNGDLVKDTFELKYRVLDPVHLEFQIFDSNGRLVNSIAQDHVAGQQEFVWDGKGSNGQIVPDGIYSIKVSEYEFFVTVDNTPPLANIDFINPDFENLRAGLEGYVFDANLEKAFLSYREAESPDGWIEFKQITENLVPHENGYPVLDPPGNVDVSTFSENRLAWAGGKQFRVTVVDRAGNRSTATSGYLADGMVLYLWNGERVKEAVPTELLGSAFHVLKGLETVKAPLASLTLQNRVGDYWMNTSASLESSEGHILVEIYESVLDPTANAIRLKGVDVYGEDHFSNVLIIKDEFALGSGCQSPVSVRNYLTEELKKFEIQYKSIDETVWNDYFVLSSKSGGVVPSGEFVVPESLEFQDSVRSTMVRARGVGISGAVYSDQIVLPSDCPVSVEWDVDYKDPDLDESTWDDQTDSDLNSEFMEAGCNTLSEKVVLSSRISGNGIVPETISFYMNDAEDQWTFLGKDDLSQANFVQQEVNTLPLAEGTYSVKSVITYSDKFGNSQEYKSLKDLHVDHSLPVAEITYPAGSVSAVCASQQGDWYGLPVEGRVNDDRGVKKYELFYGIGENPDIWKPALTRIEGAIQPIAGEKSMVGTLGVWDMTGLSKGIYSLKLKAADKAGNVFCSEATVSIVPPAEVSQLSVDKGLISPQKDTALVSYVINDPATVDVLVYDLLDGRDIFSGGATKNLVNDYLHFGGQQDIGWDGTDDSGNPVFDGSYAVVVRASDGCDNIVTRRTQVEVDGTSPDADITYPLTSDTVSSTILEVKGAVQDKNFAKYVVEIGEGESPETWDLISEGSHPVAEGVLGTWNTYGLEGPWTLRLTAVDKAGNQTEVTSLIDFESRIDLVKSFAVEPDVFSPNGDSKLDSSAIHFELAAAGQISLEILSLDGVEVHNREFTVSAGEARAHSWDGTGQDGTVVPEGAYQVKLTARDAADPDLVQVETLTMGIDIAAPLISVTEPAEASTLNDSSLNVTGSIQDENLADYSIRYRGPEGEELISESNQVPALDTLGHLSGLRDGSYVIEFEARDKAGNESSLERSFLVDSTPPELVFESPAENSFYGAAYSEINIKGGIVEPNLKRYQLRYGLGESPSQWHDLLVGESLENEEIHYSWPLDEAVTDGTYLVSLFAEDFAGQETETTRKVIVDRTLPELAITSPSAGDYIREPSDILGTASDTNLERYVVEFSEGDCANAYKWSPLVSESSSVHEATLASWQALPADGSFCMRLSAYDRAGNFDRLEIGFMVDTRPPAVPVLQGRVEGGADVRLNWKPNVESDLAGYKLYRNGKEVAEVKTQQIDFADPGQREGEYTYQVSAIDNAGNESELSNAVTLEVDTTPPSVRIASPVDGERVGDHLEIRGTAYSSDDFKEYRVYVGQGSQPQAWEKLRVSPVPTASGNLALWDVPGVQEGPYAIRLEAEDLLGNVGTDQVAVTVDDTPPPKPVFTSREIAGSDVQLSWNAVDVSDLAGYLLYRNGRLVNFSGADLVNFAPYLLNGLTFLHSDVPDGESLYTLVAMDQAGNASEPSEPIIISLDTRSPHAIIVEPDNNTAIEWSTLVRARSEDTDIASVLFQYKAAQDEDWVDIAPAVTEEPFSIYFDPMSMGLIYGSYHLRAVATDFAQKIDPEPDVKTLVYSDITAPSVPTGLEAKTSGDRVDLLWNANDPEDGAAGYNVYRDDGESELKINGSPLNDPAYVDESLSDGIYAYRISAVDDHENESGFSRAAMAVVYAPELELPVKDIEVATVDLKGFSALPGSRVQIYRKLDTDMSSVGNSVADDSGRFVVKDLPLIDGMNTLLAKSVDSSGNESLMSDPIGLVYTLPPQAPANLSGTPDGYTVALNWDVPPGDADVIGYNLYRDGSKLNSPVEMTSGTASASSYYSSWYEGHYPPSRAVDGSSWTYWKSGQLNESNPAWIEYSFTNSEIIDSLDIMWQTPGEDFQVQAWNGFDWLSLKEVVGNSSYVNHFTFEEPVRAERVRIYITKSSILPERVGIYDFDLFRPGLISDVSYQDTDLEDKEYVYSSTAVDYFGLESSHSNEERVLVGDLQPPETPEGLSLEAIGSDVNVSWDESNDEVSGVSGYNIYRFNGDERIKVNADLIADTTYVDVNLPNGSYLYAVTAVDGKGNESPPCNTEEVSVFVSLPQAPELLNVAQVFSGKALLIEWQGRDVASGQYRLYRSLEREGVYSLVNSSHLTGTHFTDEGLENGTEYCYVVASVDLAGNDSNYSNEMCGVPHDTISPDQPVFTSPAPSGAEVVLERPAIEISGTTEPGAKVDVFRDGIFVAETKALDELSIVSENFESDEQDNEYQFSPDGNYLGIERNETIYFKNLTTGIEQEVQEGVSPVWSPHGTKLSFESPDRETTSRIRIYDVDSGLIKNLTDDSFVSESNTSWSNSETRIAFLSNRHNFDDLWVKDSEHNELIKITEEISVSDAKISPDGTIIAFYNSEDLWIADIDSGEWSLVDSRSKGYWDDLSWAPDSRKIAYTSWDPKNISESDEIVAQIFTVDLDSLSVRQLTQTSENNHLPLWSPDGRFVAFKSSGDGHDCLYFVDIKGQETLVQNGSGFLKEFSWSGPNVVSFLEESTINHARIGGSFNFAKIDIYPGLNIFTARASDSSGNQSQPAEDMSVFYDVNALPDVSVAAEDVYIYPPFPKPGENVTVNATVRNLSRSAAENVDISLYLWDSSAHLNVLDERTIPILPAFSRESINLSLAALPQEGTNTVFILVDPSNSISEISEDNNEASKDFVVTGTEKIELNTHLSGSQFFRNQDVSIEVALGNSGAPRDVVLKVAVVDAEGTVLEDFAPKPVSVHYGPATIYPFSWNTANTFAGDYLVTAVVKNASGEIAAEQDVPFSILPDRNVNVAVSSEKAVYGAHELVRAEIELENAGSNSVLHDLNVRTVIVDSEERELFRSEKDVSSLWPGMKIRLSEAWNTALTSPGDYRMIVQIFTEEELSETASTAFQVKPDIRLSGDVTPESTTIIHGRNVQVSLSAENDGNMDTAGTLICSLIDPRTLSIRDFRELEIDLPQGGHEEGKVEFSTADLDLKPYLLRLNFNSGATQELIGRATLSIRDGIAPQIAVISPQQDVVYDGDVFLSVVATDDMSGVERVEYRIDDRDWLALPFTNRAAGGFAATWEASVQDGGEHTIRFRAVDQSGNSGETEPVPFKVQVDTEPPYTALRIDDPKHVGSNDAIFVTAETPFTLSATDDYSGVARTEYRIDAGEWTDEVSFDLGGLAEGEHLIEYSSDDKVGNVEEVQAQAVVVDNTPPETSISFRGQSFLDGERLLVSRQTAVTLVATDNLSGVAATHYRFDDETAWRTWHGSFDLSDLDDGDHTIHFRSTDNVDNQETARAVEVVLVGIEVDTEVLNLPRVLVWSEDPGTMKGRNKPAYTLKDIRSVVEEALNVPDVYMTMVEDKEDFQNSFRSGIYNMAMIVNQDVPFDAIFLRELREGVHRGMGLLVSSWGNNVNPVLQDVFGVDFQGSMSMDENQRRLHLYDSPLSDPQTITTQGRILKTRLDGGQLAGLIPADSECKGVRGLQLFWPVEIASGDRLKVSLSIPRGRKSVLVDEEHAVVDSLPGGTVDQSVGNTEGDISIESIDSEGVRFAVTAPYSYLEESYLVAWSIAHPDGSTTTLEPVNVTPTCAVNLCEGTMVGPFEVVGIDEERVKSGEDMPAVVLGQYGKGRTALFAYNVIESALADERSAHASLISRAATYMLPDHVPPRPAGISLLQTNIGVLGADAELLAKEELDPELTHMPLFDLTRQPLQYSVHLKAGEEVSYRYFVRFADRQGIFGKDTAISFLIDGNDTLFDRIRKEFVLENNLAVLLSEAVSWFEEKKEEYPHVANQFEEVRQELLAVKSLPVPGGNEKDQAIRRVVQVIHQVNALPFDAVGARKLLGDVLRILEGIDSSDL